MPETIRAATHEDRAIRVLAHFFGIAEDHVNRHAPLAEQGGVFDSLDAVELRVELEDEFGIYISDEDASAITGGTAQNVIDYIATRRDIK